GGAGVRVAEPRPPGAPGRGHRAAQDVARAHREPQQAAAAPAPAGRLPLSHARRDGPDRSARPPPLPPPRRRGPIKGHLLPWRPPPPPPRRENRWPPFRLPTRRPRARGGGSLSPPSSSPHP